MEDGENGGKRPWNCYMAEKSRFSRWPAEERREQVSKIALEKFPGLKNNFSWVSFLRRQRF